MNRISKDGKKIKLNIEFIHKNDGLNLKEILKEGYLKDLKLK